MGETRDEEQHEEEECYVQRPHKMFFLINSNVRKNKPVLILPIILDVILFSGGVGQGI